jgi:hypothetical protein
MVDAEETEMTLFQFVDNLAGIVLLPWIILLVVSAL